MPVTAKLSRRVYERLGDEVVNAIVDWFNQVDATYRADLREMNELNFARFDAKMGERLAELEVRFEKRFAELDAKFEKRIAELEAKFEKRFAELETKLARRFAELETRFERRLAALEVRMTRRIYLASTASLLAQIVALVTLFKIFGSR